MDTCNFREGDAQRAFSKHYPPALHSQGIVFNLRGTTVNFRGSSVQFCRFRCPGAAKYLGRAAEYLGRAAAEVEISLIGEINGKITVSAYDTMAYKAFLEGTARLFVEKYSGVAINRIPFQSCQRSKPLSREV